MTLKNIWYWGSSSEILEIVEYSFIVIIPRSTLTRNRSIYQGPIYGENGSVWRLLVLDKNTWYHLTAWKEKKKTFKKLLQKCQYKRTMHAIIT